MAGNPQELARDLAQRLAGANHSRRLYAKGSPMWQNTLDALMSSIGEFFEATKAPEITVALLGDGLAIGGIPFTKMPTNVVRFVAQLKLRDVEIISLKPGCGPTDIETLLSFLSAESAEVAATNANNWLKERGVETIAIKHLKMMRTAGMGSFREVYRAGGTVMRKQFERAHQSGVVDLGPVMDLAKSLMDMVVGSNTPVATLLAMRDRDDFSYIHSVNVGTIAGCQAAALGLSDAEIQNISTAGLLHDIGKTVLPEELVRKRGQLTPQEMQIMARHTAEGAKVLFASQGGSKLAAIAAFEHHRLPSADRNTPPPLIASQLVALADVFDGLRTLRPFDDHASMQGALAYMFLKLRNRFNPYLLGRFATLCGMFAKGDMVKLSTGELAQVVEPHPESALHPTIEVIEQETGTFEAGLILDLTEFLKSDPPVSVVLPVTAGFAQLDPQELDWLG